MSGGDEAQQSLFCSEYWVEPQVGSARCAADSPCAFLDGKSFWEIGEAVSRGKAIG